MPLTIWDINQLRALREIGKQYGVTFTLHGGVVYRLALKLNSNRELDNSPLDLFDLTPFTADIDLIHSGSPEKTGPVLDAILNDVPSAECFRWQLHSASEDREFQDAMKQASKVPARLLRLSDNPDVGLLDPENGFLDAQNRQFTYHRDPSFRLSPFYESGRNLEVFSALLYLQTLFESGIKGPDLAQPGWQNAAAVFAASKDCETKQKLRTHPYLRSRLTNPRVKNITQ